MPRQPFASQRVWLFSCACASKRPDGAVGFTDVDLPDVEGRPYDEQLLLHGAIVPIIYDAFVICASLMPTYGACLLKVFLPLIFLKISFSLQPLLRP